MKYSIQLAKPNPEQKEGLFFRYRIPFALFLSLSKVLSLVFASVLFSLDFYTVENSKEQAFLYSTRVEKPKFSVLDIHDLAKWVARLQDSQDPISQYFRERFSSDLNDLLSSETLLRQITGKFQTRDPKEQEEFKKSFSKKLIEEFNRFISGPLIYSGDSESVFSKLELSQRTLNLLEMHSNLNPEDQKYLNFFLIQESYPESIRAWNFFREDALPSQSETIQPNFRRKIQADELPYSYIEENLSEPFLEKSTVFSLPLAENPNENPIEILIQGKIFPRSTGDFYLYEIPRTQYDFGFLSGTIQGQRIAHRLNLKLFLQIENSENQNHQIQGFLHLNIQQGRFEQAVLTLFARFQPNNYFRIRGSVRGTVENSVFQAHVWDVDGRKVRDLTGSFSPVQNLLFSMNESNESLPVFRDFVESTLKD